MSEEDKKRVKLVRMPDGSMRPTTEADAIGDIWGTQKKISEQEEKQVKQKKKKKLFSRSSKKATGADFAPKIIEVPKASKQLDSIGVVANPQPLVSVKPIARSPLQPTKRIATPKKPKTKLKAPQLLFKKGLNTATRAPKWLYGVLALLLIPAAVIGFALTKNQSPQPAVQGQAVAAIPDFSTLAPNGDITDTTSQKIQYDPEKKVASFTDKINGIEITVSMQPVPETFKPGIGENIRNVAKQFYANVELSVDNGAAYIGTSEKGPQSFVGYRGDLLVFMTSTQKIADSAWAEYFNSLK